MTRMMKLTRQAGALAAAVVILATAATAARGAVNPDNSRLMERIRKELVTLPYYGVFDSLSYKLDGETVVLSGKVLRPTTRSDAERRVRKIEGVASVINNIEVLPLSNHDDMIRLRTFRAVFNTGGLHRYALGANPSIHIVVDRGHVILEGVVSSRSDSQLAYLAARRVPGVFSVTNNLRTES